MRKGIALKKLAQKQLQNEHRKLTNEYSLLQGLYREKINDCKKEYKRYAEIRTLLLNAYQIIDHKADNYYEECKKWKTSVDALCDKLVPEEIADVSIQ